MTELTEAFLRMIDERHREEVITCANHDARWNYCHIQPISVVFDLARAGGMSSEEANYIADESEILFANYARGSLARPGR